MLNAVVIDWLGRGGIAQCTHAMNNVLEAAGWSVDVVTVAGRELRGRHVVEIDRPSNRIARHRRVSAVGAEVIRRVRPELVIVQNYVIPPLERPIVEAAREVGANLVWFIHDHRMHSLLAGTTVGLRSNLESSDLVVAHSQYVADSLPRPLTTPIEVVPLPVPPEHRPDGICEPAMMAAPGALMALHFGVLKRRYKGTDTFVSLAEAGPAGWEFGVLGVNAPTSPGMRSIAEYLDDGALVATVAESSATVLPYRTASQSGVIPMAQFNGSVPVVSAVGGLREQVRDGVDGILIAPNADLEAWAAALDKLSDRILRTQMAAAGRERALANHLAFESRIRLLARSKA